MAKTIENNESAIERAKTNKLNGMFAGLDVDTVALKESFKGEGQPPSPASAEGQPPPPASAEGQPPVSENPFSQEKGGILKFETQDELLKYLNEETGTSDKDVQTFAKDYKALVENNDLLNNDAAKAKQLEEYLTNLPEDITSILLARDKNEDYRKHMGDLVSQTSDFSIPFENQNEFKMLNHYRPDKFSTKEDYRTMKDDEPDKFRDWIDIVKDKYEGDKLKFDTQRKSAINKVIDSNNVQIEGFKNSLNKSISYLNSEFPSFNEVQTKDISRTLEGGSSVILSLFYDKNGMLKQNAAESLALVKYGKDVLNEQRKKITNKVTSKVNEDIISRGKDNPLAERPSSEANRGTRKEVVEDFTKKIFPAQVGKSVFD